MKAEQIKAEMHKYRSMAEWAKDSGRTKQCVYSTLKKYNLLDCWREEHAKYYHGIHDHLCTYNGRSIAKMYFVNNPYMGFYFLSKDTTHNIRCMISSLKRIVFNNKGFQSAFNTYGYDALRCKVLVRGKDATEEKQKKFIQLCNCYNTRGRLSNAGKKRNRKKNSIRQNIKCHEKTVDLPRPIITTVGVTWNFRAQKYVAQPRIDGKQTYLGYFKTEKEAGDAIRIVLNKESKQ